MKWSTIEFFFDDVARPLHRWLGHPLVTLGLSLLLHAPMFYLVFTHEQPLAVFLVLWCEFILVMLAMVYKLQAIDFWVSLYTDFTDLIPKFWLAIHFGLASYGSLKLVSVFFERACRADGVCGPGTGAFALFGYFDWWVLALVCVALVYQFLMLMIWMGQWGHNELVREYMKSRSSVSTYLVQLQFAYTMGAGAIAGIAYLFHDNLKICLASWLALKVLIEVFYERWHLPRHYFVPYGRAYKAHGKKTRIDRETEELLNGLQEQMLDASFQLARLFSIKDVSQNPGQQDQLVSQAEKLFAEIIKQGESLPLTIREIEDGIFKKDKIDSNVGLIEICRVLGRLTKAETDWQRNFLSVLTPARIQERISQVKKNYPAEFKEQGEKQVQVLKSLLPSAK